jgi:hypothetical protein
MKENDQNPVQIWQEQLADKLRRGFAKEIKSELRKGLYHVVVAFPLTDGGTTWESCAKFSRPDRADEAVKTIRRLVVWEN